MTINIRPVVAQRFSSGDQTGQKSFKADTGFINAEKAYLALKTGNLEDARKYLSLADASNPFSLYVRAGLTQDATEAAGIYKEIVAEYPDKPIAREALLQLYRYHYAAGNYRLAHTDYLQLRKYPGMTQLSDPAGLKDTLQNTAPSMPTQNTETPPPSTSDEPTSYSIQLGVFSSQENADRFVAHLKAEDIKASVSSKIGANKTLYVVTTGDFPTREAADTFAADLRNRSIDCIVVQTGESRE